MSDTMKILKSKKSTDHSKYSVFLEKFNNKFGDYFPDNIEHFVNKNHSSHNALRKILGAEAVKFKFTMKIGQEELSPRLRDEFMAQILKIMPKFAGHYAITSAILKWPMYSLMIDVSGRSKKRDIRTSSFITGYAEKFAKISDEDRKNLNKILEQLGQHWAKLRDVNKEFVVKLTTSPTAFTMIGHYGPDDKSCFRHGKENWKHKYKLATYQDTFVFLISAKENDSNKYKVLSRQWGFYNDGLFNICNLYFAKLNETIVEKINHLVFSHLLNKDIKLHKNLINIDRKAQVYHNTGKHDWTFASKEICAIGTQTLI